MRSGVRALTAAGVLFSLLLAGALRAGARREGAVPR